MTLARLVIAATVLTGFAWLHWHTIPFIGVFRLDHKCPPPPKTGTILALIEDQTCTAAYSLDMLETGWSIVNIVWPFTLAGLLLGIATRWANWSDGNSPLNNCPKMLFA